MSELVFEPRTFLALLCVVVVSFVAVGCGDDPNAPEANSNEPQKQRSAEDVANEAKNFEQPPPVQILYGDKTGIRTDEPIVRVVRSHADMKKLKKEHFSKGLREDFVAETDYKTRQIIGVFAPKQRPTTVLTVVDVYPNKDKNSFTVEAVLLVPPKDCDLPKGSPRPFNVVESALMKGEPVLKLKKQEASSC